MNDNLAPDPSQLDEEWLIQTQLFDDAQEKVAEYLDARDTLKRQLSNLESDRAEYLRVNFEKEGFVKAPPIGVVDNWVTCRGEVQLLKEDLHVVQIQFARANNLVESLQMKKRALEKLCDLHGMNYFSVPNPNHMIDGGKRFIEDKKEKVEEGSKSATAALNEKKQSRKRKSNEEVLDTIKDPGVKADLEKHIKKEEETKPKSNKRRRRS
jgi:hypothetical protein